MDFGLLLLAVFLIYIVAVKKQDARRKKQRAPMSQPPKSKETKRTAPETAGGGAKEIGFDAEGFRARLRMAWGEKAPEAESVHPQPEKMETPAPVRVTDSLSRAGTVSSASRVMGATETERARRRAEEAKKMKQVSPRKTEPIGAFGGESAEEAMRRWVRYDAVLGKPRSREKWQSPAHKSC